MSSVLVQAFQLFTGGEGTTEKGYMKKGTWRHLKKGTWVTFYLKTMTLPWKSSLSPMFFYFSFLIRSQLYVKLRLKLLFYSLLPSLKRIFSFVSVRLHKKCALSILSFNLKPSQQKSVLCYFYFKLGQGYVEYMFAHKTCINVFITHKMRSKLHRLKQWTKKKKIL